MRRILLIIGLFISLVGHGQTVYEYYSSPAPRPYIIFNGSPYRFGQTFTIGTTGTNENFILDYITLDISKVAAYTVYVQIYATTGGLPSGTAISSGSVSAGTDIDDGNIIMTPVVLQAGTMYAIVVYSTVEYTRLFQAEAGTIYQGGSVITYNGSVWSNFTEYDLVFAVYGHRNPVITSNPESITRCEGTSATFSVTSTANSPAYQWRKNGFPISGATEATYTISSVTTANAASYSVTVTDGLLGTSVTSGSATLTISAGVVITTQSISLTRCVGSIATFSVTATGSGLTYQWKKNGSNITGATGSSYSISNVATTDAGAYTCTVANSCNSVTSNTANLTVSTLVAITSQPASVEQLEGTNATFSVIAIGSGLTYQWKKNGTNIAGATNNIYTIPNISESNEASYTVTVTGTCNTVTSNAATLTIVEPPPAGGQTCEAETYLRFENNATDATGNHTWTAQNSAGYTTTNAVEGTYTSNLNVSSTNRFISDNIDWTSGGGTIAFNFRTVKTSGQGVILTNQITSQSTKGFLLRHDTEFDRLIYTDHNGTNFGHAYTVNNSIAANTQYHIVIRKLDVNGANVQIFINGTLSSTTDSVAYAGSGLNTTWSLGCSKEANAYSIEGTIDKFEVYKWALSNSQITTLYNNRAANSTITTGCPGEGNPVGNSVGKQILLNNNHNNFLLSNRQKLYEVYPYIALPPVDPGIPASTELRIVFAENFDGLSTGQVSRTQRAIWNANDGYWDSPNATVVTHSGRGNVLRCDFKTGLYSQPILNTIWNLDSIYHHLVVQFDYYIPAGFNYLNGGKGFMSVVGGRDVDIPYRGDTTGSGFNTLKMFQPGNIMSWYDYTHNAVGYGLTLTSEIQMPSSSRTGSLVLGKDYSWGNPYSYASGPTGFWYAWPTQTTWDAAQSKYVSINNTVSTFTPGQWVTYTFYYYLKDGGFHDIEEVYKNGICTFSRGNNRFRTIGNINWGIEGLYINAFYGGSPVNPSTDQYWLVDNIVAYVLPSNHDDFHTTAAPVGSTIGIVGDTTVYVNSPAKPVQNERYTEASGTIHSHNKAFHYIPKDITSSKWVSVAGATTYSLTMTEYAHHPNCTDYYRNWVRIYRYNSGVATLADEYDCDSYTLHTTNMTCDSVRIDFYTGEGDEYNNVVGYTFTYTSNGTGSGINPFFPSAADMVAARPEESSTPQNSTAFTINTALGKGVNCVDLVPYGGTCTPQWTFTYYDAIQAGGFDHVRAVFFGFNESGGANYEISASVLANVKTIIDAFIVRGIKVVLDYHQPAFLLYPSSTNNDRFVSHWGQLADYFSTYSINDLVFELTNEPLEDYATWNTLAAEAVAAIRVHSSSSQRIIILSPALWAQVAGLQYLTLPDDDGLILSIHYYKPTTFTHQGMSGNEGAVGGHWYNVAPMVKEINEYFYTLDTFSANHNIPVNIGEFGVNKDYGALLADRASYTNYHTRYFDAKGWSYAIWDFKQDFGIYTSGAYITDMLDAIMTDPMPTLSDYDSTVIYQSNFVNTTGWSATGANLSVSGGQLICTVTTPGSVPSDVIVQYPISLEKNKIYRVTYTVSSASSRYTIIKTPYLEWDQPTVTTSQYTNERSFTHYFTNYNGYVQFCIGGTSATFYIHSFKIERLDLL